MTNQVNQEAFEKCDCLNFCGDDIRISKCKVEPCQDYKRPSAIVSAERVYTAGYGSVETGGIDITSTKEGDLKAGDFLYSKCSVIQMIEAATQARDSEINSLKQRVEELQADNLRLREALERIVKADDNVYNCEDDYQGDVIGKLSDIHFKAYNKARKVLSSTPTQSLASHDNEEK